MWSYFFAGSVAVGITLGIVFFVIFGPVIIMALAEIVTEKLESVYRMKG